MIQCHRCGAESIEGEDVTANRVCARHGEVWICLVCIPGPPTMTVKGTSRAHLRALLSRAFNPRVSGDYETNVRRANRKLN